MTDSQISSQTLSLPASRKYYSAFSDHGPQPSRKRQAVVEQSSSADEESRARSTASPRKRPVLAKEVNVENHTRRPNAIDPRSRERRAESPAPPSSAENITRLPNDDNLENSDLKVDSSHFRADLNRRMGILNHNKAKEARDKLDRRRFVLEECFKRGLNLRSNFSTYPYESKMYPTIKWITAIAPPAWGWDRVIARDIIRTLCWDRVRSINRRNRAENPEAAQRTSRRKEKPKPTRQIFSDDGVQPPLKERSLTKERPYKPKPTRQISDSSDDEVQPPRKGPAPRRKYRGPRARSPMVKLSPLQHSVLRVPERNG